MQSLVALFIAGFSVLFVACATPGSWATNEPQNCADLFSGESFRGVVLGEEGEPLEHAQVFYPSIGCGVLADARGRFELPRLDEVLRIELVLYAAQVVQVGELERGERVHTFSLTTSPRTRLRVTDDYSRWDDRPTARDDAPRVPGCFWVGGGEWGGLKLHLREDGMLVQHRPDEPVTTIPRGEFAWDDPQRPIRLGGPPYNWYPGTDTISISIEWYPDAGKVGRLLIDEDSRSDSIPFEIYRWTWTLARYVERTAAIWVDCGPEDLDQDS